MTAIAIGVAVALQANAARADPTQEEGAMASALFEEGRTLMASGRYDEACDRLAESHRLEPAGGTLLNLAECRRRQGRTATSYSLYTDALAFARRDRRDDRVDVCKRALAELAPRLATVRIVVPEASRAVGLVVRMNGVAVPELARGTDLPVDPGRVTVEAEADHHAPRSWRVDVADAGHAEITIEPLERLARSGVSAAQETSSPEVAPPVTPAPDPVARRPSATLRLDLDGRGRGAVTYVGIGYGLASFVDVGAGALLGGSSGLEVGARALLPFAVVRPYATVAMPIFFRDGARAGARAGGGVEVSVHRHVAISVQASGVYFPEPGTASEGVAFVPALGIVGRL
ncbi:MAG: tetratricopeptide repeat protein [Deltaproteobacteria bacterium]|nr:tetratricopeptide repeat protein [Deltaproteobacteria bacterium]